MSHEDQHQSRVSPEVLQRLLQSRRRFLDFLERRVESKADAEDILQAAFVRGIERGGDLRDEESAVAWFYRLLRNAVIDHYRQKASAARVVEEWAEDLDEIPDSKEALKQSLCQCIAGIIPELKPEYQQAIEIVDLEEGNLQDLASRAAISSNNAAVRVHRARQALKWEVELACGVCAAHGCLDCHCKSHRLEN